MTRAGGWNLEAEFNTFLILLIVTPAAIMVWNYFSRRRKDRDV